MYKISHQYFLYIITNKKDGVLYIGITNNLERRIYEHKNKLIKGFSSLASETFSGIASILFTST